MPLSLCLVLLSCQPDPDPGFARASIIQDLTDGIGGIKALAQPGDILLENDRVRFAIAGERISFGPGIDGGSILDADLRRAGSQWSGGHGNDRLSELVSTVNLFVPGVVAEGGTVSILEDTGEAAIVRVSAPMTPFLDLVKPLVSTGGGVRPGWVVTDYILRPKEQWLTIRTTVGLAAAEIQPPIDGPVVPGLEGPESIVGQALLGGLALGDFVHLGGNVDVFASEVGFHELGAVYDAQQAGRNLFIEPLAVDLVGGTSDGVSYGIAVLDGKLLLPLVASSQTAAIGGMVSVEEVDASLPGATWTYERIFVVGHGDMGSVLDVVLEARGTKRARVRGHVVEEGTGKPLSGVQVLVYKAGGERPYSEWRTDVGLEDNQLDGSFSGLLAEGDWELQVHEKGRPSGPRIAIAVTDGSPTDLTLAARRTGEVLFRIVDEAGLPIPGKVTVFTEDGSSVLDPILGDGFIGGDPAAVVFAGHGMAEVQLPPGAYVAYATHGPEYELGHAVFDVDVSRPVEIELQVVHSVDTAGWISADFHVHADPSFDSGVSLRDRVITMAAEGVEFLVSSDHDQIVDYAPVIEDLGLEQWVQSAIGLEVTPMEAGHYLGFPLDHDFLEEAGGAMDWTGMIPREILDGIKELGADPVTIVAHPRDGILGYFDQFGFDPYSGTPGNAVANPGTSAATNPFFFKSQFFSLEFDALEILNGKRYDFIRTPTQSELDQHAATGDVSVYQILSRTDAEQAALVAGEEGLGFGIKGQVDDWFSLLNLGYKHTALGNSDTHGKTTVEAGCPRNWVMAPTDNPAFLTAEDVAEAVRKHQVVLSYGPFISLYAEGDQPIGSEISVDDGVVTLDIEVRSPSWFDVDRVELYENGTQIQSWTVTTPNVDTVNFLASVDIAGEADAWYVVIAVGNDSLEPLFTPVDIPPIQLQDVVAEAITVVPALAALAGDPVPIPRDGAVVPFAMTNPIWVDRDGGGFDAPGLPEWLSAPVEPVSE
jgi:hypothetical protein